VRSQRNQSASAPSGVANSTPRPTPDPNEWIDWGRSRAEAAAQTALDEWRTPIEFYGKVVDENTNPVAAAEVDFDCNDTSVEGTSFYHARADANGLFSIKGIQGKVLGVKVNKSGYYACLPFGESFCYAGRSQNFVPDAVNPVIFRLKKKGVAEPLIHVHAGTGGVEGVQIQKDGTAVEISLANGNAVPRGNGDLRVRCWTEDQGSGPGKKYNWKCEIDVPDGGLALRTGDLDFEAPSDGYQPSDVIDMTTIWLLPVSPYLCMAAGSLNLIEGKSLRVAYVYSLVVLSIMALIELVTFHGALKLIALGNIVAGGLWAYGFRGVGSVPGESEKSQ
jgi:hypothetical protein